MKASVIGWCIVSLIGAIVMMVSIRFAPNKTDSEIYNDIKDEEQ